MSIMCIDYGTKNTGVAVSDPKLISAMPLDTIKLNPQKQPNKMYKVLADMCAEYKVEKFIVGVPVNHQKNSVEGITKEIVDFSNNMRKQLRKRYKPEIEIELWDETLSSKEAEKKFASKDPRIHAEAARVILQDYLNFIQEYKTQHTTLNYQ